MSRGRCYPDVGAWSGPRKLVRRIVGVREIRVEERRTARKGERERERKREVWISRKFALEYAGGHTIFFFSVAILFFSFPSSPRGRSPGQKKKTEENEAERQIVSPSSRKR